MTISTFRNALVSVTALLMLTGAQGEGCGGSGEPEPDPEPPPIACPEGSHIELVCDGGCDDDIIFMGGTDGGGPNEGFYSEPGYPEGPDEPVAPPHPGECEEICVPDNACPPDHYEELICEGYGGAEPGGGGVCLDPEGCETPEEPPYWEEECFSICVPFDDFCPPGMYLDYACDEYGCYDTCVDGGEPGDPGEPPPEPVPAEEPDAEPVPE